MSDPQSPNFKTGVGRLVTDRLHFQQHVDGYSFRHEASNIDFSPPITIGSDTYDNLQDITQTLVSILDPSVPDDATTTVKGIIQLSGDIAGTATSIRVTRIQGVPISTTVPTTIGQILTWNGTAWTPSVSSSIFTPGGDLSGNNLSQTVIALQGRSVANTTPTSGQVLQWSQTNSRWEPTSFHPTGTGLVATTSGVINSAATANIRYTDRLQTDTSIQWRNSSITGDLAWTPTLTNKTLTLPNVTDTLVARTTTDTLTNKTINAADNTITDTSAVAGDLLVHNGTRFVRQAKGADGTFWGVSSGTAGYYSVSEMGGGLTLPNTIAGIPVLTDGENGIIEGPIPETHGTLLQVQFGEGGASLIFDSIQLHNPDSVSGVLEVINGGTALTEDDLLGQAGMVLAVNEDETGYELVGLADGTANSVQLSDGYGNFIANSTLGLTSGGTLKQNITNTAIEFLVGLGGHSTSSTPFSLQMATVDATTVSGSYNPSPTEIASPIWNVTNRSFDGYINLPATPGAIYFIQNTAADYVYVRAVGDIGEGASIPNDANAIVYHNGTRYIVFMTMAQP